MSFFNYDADVDKMRLDKVTGRWEMKPRPKAETMRLANETPLYPQGLPCRIEGCCNE